MDAPSAIDCIFLAVLLAWVVPVQAQDAHALRARHATLLAALADNPFGAPLYVESSEKSGEHKGGIYAEIEEPFKRVSEKLRRAAQWCEVLVLQSNVKSCEAANAGTETLSILVARKPADSLDSAHRIDFTYRVPAAAADYRNTMRYYLALEAYLGTLHAPAAGRLEQRLRAFHAGLERYPLQLRELELAEYLRIKRRDASGVVQQARQ